MGINKKIYENIFFIFFIVIKKDFRKNLVTYFIFYNTKNNFFIPKKLFYDYNIKINPHLEKNYLYSHKIRFSERSRNLFYDYNTKNNFFILKKLFYDYKCKNSKNQKEDSQT
jgi:hypothetical protein